MASGLTEVMGNMKCNGSRLIPPIVAICRNLPLLESQHKAGHWARSSPWALICTGLSCGSHSSRVIPSRICVLGNTLGPRRYGLLHTSIRSGRGRGKTSPAMKGGWDDPDPVHITYTTNGIAYWDSPGPNPIFEGNKAKMRPARVHAIQNFTAWVEGEPSSGGAPVRASPVTAWCCVIDLIDPALGKGEPEPEMFKFTSMTGAQLGWLPTESPPLM